MKLLGGLLFLTHPVCTSTRLQMVVSRMFDWWHVVAQVKQVLMAYIREEGRFILRNSLSKQGYYTISVV